MTKITDDMFSMVMEEIVQEAIEEEENKLPGEPVKFTKRFEKKMNRMCHKVNTPYLFMLNRTLKAVACFLLAAIISGTILVLKVDGFRQKFFEIIDWMYDTYGIKKFQSDETLDEEMRQPGYLPEGFRNKSKFITENFSVYQYSNGMDVLRVSLTLINEEMRLYYDTEYNCTERIKLKYAVGNLYKKDGKYIKLLFYRGMTQYEIYINNSKFDKNDVIKIANSF